MSNLFISERVWAVQGPHGHLALGGHRTQFANFRTRSQARAFARELKAHCRGRWVAVPILITNNTAAGRHQRG